MLKAWIDNCGKLIYFGLYNNGQYPSVTKINNNPTIGVNGQTVSTGSGIFLNNSQNTPWVAYQPYCGEVEHIAIENGGYNITNPSFSCSGVVFGPAIVTTGVTHYNIHNNNTTFPSTPSLWIPSLRKLPTVISLSGNLIAIQAKAENILARQQIAIGTPLTVSIGVGQGCVADPIVISGQITAINIVNGNNGNNYPSSMSVNIWDSTGSGAYITPKWYGGSIWGFNIISGGDNYSPNPTITLAPSGNNCCIEPVIDTYLQYVPVVSSTYFYNRPDIVATDATGSGISLVAIMKGITDNDTVSYSAPANWVSASNITIPATANAPVDNWVGKKEASEHFDIPSFTGYTKVGVNLGEQPVYPGLPNCPLKNKYYQSNGWSITGGGTIQYDASGTPVSWPTPYNLAIARWIYGPSTNNAVDSQGPPNQTGPWLLRYNDPYVNTATGSCVTLGGNSNNTNIDILNLSGPNKGSYSGVVVDPRDITIKNGQVLLSNQYTQLGSGYEAALITIAGADGKQASFVPIINSGIIQNYQRIQIGQNYSYKPTIKVYGLGREGTSISGIFNYSYKPNKQNRAIDVALWVSQISGSYLINNVYITSPDPYTNEVQPPDDNLYTSTDISIIKSLSGVDCVRYMDLTGGYGGPNNIIDETDLINPHWDVWNVKRGTTATFQYCRKVNTDPSNTGYGWYTDRIYGTPDIFCDGEDSFGRYKLLPPNDNGQFTSNYGAYQNVVFQLRSTQPHNLKSGKLGVIWANNNNTIIPITNANNFTMGVNYGIVWVSDAYTIILMIYIQNNIKTGTPWNNATQTINSNQEIDLTMSGTLPGWSVATNLPLSNSSISFDFTKNTSKQLNCANWVNIPVAYNSGLIEAIASQVSGSPEIYVEYGNEIWSGNNFQAYAQAWNNLLGYLPSGMKFGDYYTTNGNRPQYGTYGSSLLMAARSYDLLEKFAGVPPDKFHRVMGAFYAQYYWTGVILENAANYGIDFDHIAIAPYCSINADSVIINAMTPFGVRGIPDAGGLPPDAINSLVRHYILYNNYDAQIWAGHQKKISFYQQPVNSLSLTLKSPSGSHLPTANYTAYCTFADAAGLETTVGLSESMYVGINSGALLVLSMPAAPKWATTCNIYLSNQPNTTPILYESIPTNIYYPSQNISITGGWPAQKIYPPMVNYASGYIKKFPTLVTYEGGIDHTVPGSVPFWNNIAQDTNAHPSFSLSVEDWYKNCAYRGAVLTNYYQAYGFPFEWFLSAGTSQIEGIGDDNQYSLYGYPADGADHTDTNKSTGLYGLHRVMNARTSPLQPPIPIDSGNIYINHHVWRQALANYFRRSH